MWTVQQLWDVTKKLNDHLNEGIQEDRDAYIDVIANLLEERQGLLDRLPKSYSEEEKRLGKEIVTFTRNIDAKLEEQFQFLKDELEQFQLNKRRREQYANPYANVSIDGMYFDKKK